MRLYKKQVTELALILFICLQAFPVSAWNQLPLLTDSHRVLPAGQVQLGAGFQFLSHKNFPFSTFSDDFARDVLSLPTLAMNFGLGKRVELQMTYELLFVEEEQLRVRELWKSGDLALFTKLELLEERRRLPGMGLKFGAKLPNASDTYRVGTDETDLAFTALFGKTFSPISIHANLGLLILGSPFENARQDDLLGYGIACVIPRKPNMTYAAEVIGQTFGTSHNERASAVFHVYYKHGALLWNISSRVGLLNNSENWGISGGVCWTID
jgi:hypothetical protein